MRRQYEQVLYRRDGNVGPTLRSIATSIEPSCWLANPVASAATSTSRPSGTRAALAARLARVSRLFADFVDYRRVVGEAARSTLGKRRRKAVETGSQPEILRWVALGIEHSRWSVPGCEPLVGGSGSKLPAGSAHACDLFSMLNGCYYVCGKRLDRVSFAAATVLDALLLLEAAAPKDKRTTCCVPAGLSADSFQAAVEASCRGGVPSVDAAREFLLTACAHLVAGVQQTTVRGAKLTPLLLRLLDKVCIQCAIVARRHMWSQLLQAVCRLCACGGRHRLGLALVDVALSKRTAYAAMVCRVVDEVALTRSVVCISGKPHSSSQVMRALWSRQTMTTTATTTPATAMTTMQLQVAMNRKPVLLTSWSAYPYCQ